MKSKFGGCYEISDSEDFNYPAFMAMELKNGYLNDVHWGKYFESDVYNDELSLPKRRNKLNLEGEKMYIETKRLIIRDLQMEDKLAYIAMASDGSLNDCGFDKECDKWIEPWIRETRKLVYQDNPAKEYLAYTICLKNENTVIGSVGCSYYEDIQETGITYFIDSRYRNKGYATEAVQVYVNYFLSHYDIPRLIATVRHENISSWKVVEKIGFVLTEKRMYKDLNDDKEELYHFYELKKE